MSSPHVKLPVLSRQMAMDLTASSIGQLFPEPEHGTTPAFIAEDVANVRRWQDSAFDRFANRLDRELARRG